MSNVVALSPQLLNVEQCPKCHGPVEHGHGLAFGGFGGYVFCCGHDGEKPSEGCGWFHKVQDPDGDPGPTA